MVAAGVYLVGRFYPVFTPEVLLVIAIIGCITLFLAATIAMTATDIKRVLAYSTVSQLGYMMLALGLGGWLAGMFHLFTHAFFKSLLFLCSGSVIHACGTNEMPAMGGLRRKMPVHGLHHAGRLLGHRRGGHSDGDRLERLPLEGPHRRPGAFVLARESAVGRAFLLRGAGRGGDDGVLHVPPVVHDVRRQSPRRHVYHHAHESPEVDDRAAGDLGGSGRGGGVERAVDRPWARSAACSRPGRRESPRASPTG